MNDPRSAPTSTGAARLHRFLPAVLALAAGCTAPNPEYQAGGSDDDAPDAPPAASDALTPGDAKAADGGSASTFTFRQSLIGYWKFDDAPGSTSAADASGMGNHGLLERLDPQAAWVAGRRGGALQISGSDKEAGVRVTASASIAALHRFTVAAWAYRTSVGSEYASVISRQIDDSYFELYNLSFTGSLISIYLPANPAEGHPYVTRSRRNTPAAQWIHVAATYDGSRVRLYLDGVEENVMTYDHPFPAATTPLYLGNNKNPSDGEPMVGRIDDVLLYSEALSAAAIAALAAGGVPSGL
jgi:large repetitive protein